MRHGPPRSGRLPLLSALVAVTAAIALARAPAGPAGVDALEALRQTLADRDGLVIAPGDIAWEGTPPRGLSGALVPARAIALGARRAGAPRDLYRIEVLVSPAGRSLSISRPVNLTRTPVGDDQELVVAPPFAAYATRAYGQVQAVTLLDLRGASSEALDALDRMGRLRNSVSDLLTTGDLDGVGRMVVSLDAPLPWIALAFTGRHELELRWAGGAVAVDAASGRVVRGAGVRTERAMALPKPFVLWTVDTVRAVVGAAPITWLEARTFAALDYGRRLMHGSLHARAPASRPVVYRAVPNETDEASWPPPPVPSALGSPEQGEGRWRGVAPPFVKRLPGAPPAIVETFVRADAARPYTRVYIAAMDLRQLHLGMVAGAEDPEPTVGAPGTGRLPRREAVLDQVVAAFNGGFKSKHGAYGMVEERRILLPPVHDAATITTHSDGRIGIGSWPGHMRLPDDVVSLRQNLDPLVDRGVLNPKGRRIWGFPLPEMETMETGRSGLCITGGGNLLYFYGTDLSGPILGRAMLQASCSYGIHLDMNPYHCAFIYARIRSARDWLAATDSPTRARFRGWPTGEALYDAAAMRHGMMDPKRYLLRSPKDFFYVTLRREVLPPGELGWTSSGLSQPAPAFLPSFHHGRDGAVELWSVAPGRADVMLRAGTRERFASVAGGAPIPAVEGARPLLAIELSEPPAAAGRIVAGRIVREGRVGAPTLARRADGSIVVAPWPVDGAQDAVQGEPLEAGSGQALRAQPLPAQPLESALGLDSAGRVTVARGPVAALAAALRRAGATTSLRLGAGVVTGGLRVEPAGATLYLLARPPRPMAFRIDRAGGAL